MTLVVENWSEWETALLAALEDNRRFAEQKVIALADDIGDRERQSGPRGVGAHGIDTITVIVGRSSDLFFVDVGPDKSGFYLAFYEFGTEHQPPRPFMRPAVTAAVSAWSV